MALVGGGPPSPRGAPGPTAALAVSSTVAIIKLSELLQQAELPPATALLLLAVPCALQWRLLDGSRASLALASMLEAPSGRCRGSRPRPPGAGSLGSWRRHAPGAKGWDASTSVGCSGAAVRGRPTSLAMHALFDSQASPPRRRRFLGTAERVALAAAGPAIHGSRRPRARTRRPSGLQSSAAPACAP